MRPNHRDCSTDCSTLTDKAEVVADVFGTSSGARANRPLSPSTMERTRRPGGLFRKPAAREFTAGRRTGRRIVLQLFSTIAFMLATGNVNRPLSSAGSLHLPICPAHSPVKCPGFPGCHPPPGCGRGIGFELVGSSVPPSKYPCWLRGCRAAGRVSLHQHRQEPAAWNTPQYRCDLSASSCGWYILTPRLAALVAFDCNRTQAAFRCALRAGRRLHERIARDAPPARAANIRTRFRHRHGCVGLHRLAFREDNGTGILVRYFGIAPVMAQRAAEVAVPCKSEMAQPSLLLRRLHGGVLIPSSRADGSARAPCSNDSPSMRGSQFSRPQCR